MVRRKRDDKRRSPSPFGVPSGIVLFATPEGWRHTLLTEEGGMHCGRLANVPFNADPAEARAAAAAMVVALAYDFHNLRVDVTWEPEPLREPESWTAQVTALSTPPNA
ncbi:hypothetical protein DWB77_07284 [Streptomyces hundungensis]|uniref:Uncharacterized protein n=1 Tax=Streptomyces hundungensis TaxID=1077946 RepID=A0A387HSG2_9ACTN|nr:hypothetical protein [Streptomyces hundungensis]AYG85068.1 hypothetical protein DWB77_07284 [Streptomyces hundungensis]